VEATQLAARTRVAMVEPPSARVQADLADLRAEPRRDSELVDQAHLGEALRVLGAAGGWRYVQGEDQYFGWISADDIHEPPARSPSGVVAVLLADVHERASFSSAVIARLPAGTRPSGRVRAVRLGDPEERARDWMEVVFSPPGGVRTGYVATGDLTRRDEVPSRYPTPDDLIATAEPFLGAPYLWGGTTVRGLDCSGFVQQVYRLNGVGLPRDADQQALFGRAVERASRGDLLFFGADRVTHVALATSESEFLHAPQSGAVVERGTLGPERRLRTIRRYFPDYVRET